MPITIIATSAFGLEAAVAREIEGMGYTPRIESTGRVAFQGDALAVAKANLWLRSADRVLIRVGQFHADNFDALFEGTKSLPWEQWITAEAQFPVNGRSVKSQLSSVPACQRAVKRAIVDRLMFAHRRLTLPETAATGGRVTIEIALLDNVASLTIDTSGDGLHKRGYRPMVGDAALKETMAAGLVLLSAWRPWRPLIDPFCGTGTIAIEAAMIGRNLAPGMTRSFDGEDWPALPEAIWESAREEARGLAKPPGSLAHAIHASDIDERALDIARRAAKLAGGEHAQGVDRDIHFHRRDFAQLASKIEYGCIVTNPPYGVRLGETLEIERLYRSLPLVLRALPTWSFHILTARNDLEDIVGQPATRRRKLYNSQIECTYFTFLGPKPPRSAREQLHRGNDAASHSATPSAPSQLDSGGPDELGNDHPDEMDQALPAKLLSPKSTQDSPRSFQDLDRTGRNRDETLAFSPLPARDGDDDSETAKASDDPLAPPVLNIDGQDSATGESEPSLTSSPQLPAGHAVREQADRAEYRPPAVSSGPAFGGLRERDTRELSDFRACLEKNVRHLRKYPARGITCYRLYERDQVDVPLIIDIYEGRVHIAEYEREHSRTLAQQADWYDRVREIVSSVVGVSPSEVYFKEKYRQRGLTQHEKIDDARARFAVLEDGLRFEVNLSDYIDTGLFLDHRLTRAMVRDQSAGKRFLNLFCYTGAFTVYAAAGRDGVGAASTTSVDLSNTYLEWAQRNLTQNKLWPGSHRLLRADTLDFLSGHSPGEHYDLVVVDPPTFSNSKRTEDDWEVAVGHSQLFTLLFPLLAPGAVVYFSTNYRRFHLDEQLLAGLNARFQDVSNRTVPPEYRNRRIHRCWRIVKQS